MGFAAPFGLFLYATDTAKQTVDALSRCNLTISYRSLLDFVTSLAEKSLSKTRAVACRSHLLGYDNINLSTSIFVEQRGRGETPAKVTNGTMGIIYELRNHSDEHTRLAPILHSLHTSPALDFYEDIIPNDIQVDSIASQLRITIIHSLLRHCPAFSTKSYAALPQFQYRPRRQLPQTYRTTQYPTRVTTINEQSIEGNIQYTDNLYIDQLGLEASDLEDIAILCINDQLTNARIRGMRSELGAEHTAWGRRANFQLAPGLFHTTQAFIWMILKHHLGSDNDPSSLTYMFTLLDKTRLSGEKPDYHTLFEALCQVLDGILLDAWERECGFPSLEEFAASKPIPEDLHRIADQILLKYTDPIDEEELNDVDAGADSLVDDSDSSTSSDPHSDSDLKYSTTDRSENDIDIVGLNLKRLAGHLLYAVMLREAIRDGDFGRIEDFLGHLAAMFCAGGSKNYCFEMLYFINHLHNIWPVGFAYVALSLLFTGPLSS
jgi:hypothetical protein